MNMTYTAGFQDCHITAFHTIGHTLRAVIRKCMFHTENISAVERKDCTLLGHVSQGDLRIRSAMPSSTRAAGEVIAATQKGVLTFLAYCPHLSPPVAFS